MSSTEEKTEEEQPSANQNPQIDYELLKEDYPNYDLSFKVIVIGNSGNYYFIKYIKITNNKYRSWKIMLIHESYKKKI